MPDKTTVGGTFTFKVTDTYHKIKSINLGTGFAHDERLKDIRRIGVVIENDSDFYVEGALQASGVISGMAKVYARLGLTVGREVSLKLLPDDEPPLLQISADSIGDTSDTEDEPLGAVFRSKCRRHVHLEPFRPENMNHWEPYSEGDVYLAFGILQKFTDYQYCCGVSKSLLEKLGADYDNTTKPDAVLISRITGEYMMAEWKMRSSDFKKNHRHDDVDVVVCWRDDETDRKALPRFVLVLHEVAIKAAESALLDPS